MGRKRRDEVPRLAVPTEPQRSARASARIEHARAHATSALWCRSPTPTPNRTRLLEPAAAAKSLSEQAAPPPLALGLAAPVAHRRGHRRLSRNRHPRHRPPARALARTPRRGPAALAQLGRAAPLAASRRCHPSQRQAPYNGSHSSACPPGRARTQRQVAQTLYTLRSLHFREQCLTSTTAPRPFTARARKHLASAVIVWGSKGWQAALAYRICIDDVARMWGLGGLSQRAGTWYPKFLTYELSNSALREMLPTIRVRGSQSTTRSETGGAGHGAIDARPSSSPAELFRASSRTTARHPSRGGSPREQRWRRWP